MTCQVVKQIDIFFFFCVPNMSASAGKNKHFLMPLTLTAEELESGPEICQPWTSSSYRDLCGAESYRGGVYWNKTFLRRPPSV